MKKLSALIVLVVFFLPQGVSSSPDTAAKFAEITRDLASRIKAFFPIVEVYVVSVQNNQVYIESGEGNKLRKGMEMQLFREGKEFTHPITGASLGKFEESLGIIRIADVKEAYAICDIVSLKDGAVVKRADKVRITSSSIKLAVFMEEISVSPDLNVDAFVNNLVYKLEESRFEVVSRGEVILAMGRLGISEEKQIDIPDNYKKLGRKLGVAAFVVSSINRIDGSQILNSRIISAATGKQIDKITLALPMPSHVVLVQQPTEKKYSAPVSPPGNGLIKKKTPIMIKKDSEFVKKLDKSYLGLGKGVRQSQEFDYEIISFTTGDFDGDGKKEIATIDGKRLRIYEAGSAELSLVWSDPEETYGCVMVDAADLNHNGRDEIFVTNVVYSRLQSYVIEYQNGKYVRMASKLPYFFRSVRFPKSSAKQLFMQRIGVATPFSGPIYTCIFENGQYIEGKALDLPDSISIFGFATADVDRDGERDVIYVDDYDRLRVFSKEGKLKWKSSSRYGGYGLSFAHTSKRVFTSQATLSRKKAGRVKVKGRIFIMDLDGNGVNEVILSQNFSSFGSLFPNSPGFSKSRIVDLEWDGISFSENWETKHIEAYVSDFDIGDLYGDGQTQLMIGIVLNRGITSIFTGKKSVILFYRL